MLSAVVKGLVANAAKLGAGATQSVSQSLAALKLPAPPAGVIPSPLAKGVVGVLANGTALTAGAVGSWTIEAGNTAYESLVMPKGGAMGGNDLVARGIA